MNPIRKLNLMVFDNALTEPADLKALHAELKSTSAPVQTMRTVISMVQQGYDLSSLSGDVLRLIDTSDPRLKLLCNVFLRRTCMNRPACQLMCTNTFLKDFNDRNWQIQLCATNDAIELGDEILIKNYVYDLKRMCKHDKSEIRTSAGRTLAVFYRKSPVLFFRHGLDAILKKLLDDKTNSVVIEALHAIADIEDGLITDGRTKNAEATSDDDCQDKIGASEILSMPELLALYSRHKSHTAVIRAVMSVMKSKSVGDNATDMLRRLLYSDDVVVFFIAAKKLLEISEKYTKDIFNQACGFLDLRHEQLYNVLLFIIHVVGSARCCDQTCCTSNTSDGKGEECLYALLKNNRRIPFLFTPHNSDPDYIKKLKLKLMISFGNETSPILSNYFYDPKYNLFIFELFLHHNIESPQILNGMAVNQLIDMCRIVINTPDISRGWTVSLSGFLETSDLLGEYIQGTEALPEQVAMPESHALAQQDMEMLLLVAGNLCNKVPSWIARISQRAHTQALLVFYIKLMHRNILSLEDCLGYLEKLRIAAPQHRRTHLFIQNLERARSSDTCAILSALKQKYSAFPSISSIELLEFNNKDVDRCSADGHAREIWQMDAMDTSARAKYKDPGNFKIVEKLPVIIECRNYRGELKINDADLILNTEWVSGEVEFICGGGKKEYLAEDGAHASIKEYDSNYLNSYEQPGPVLNNATPVAVGQYTINEGKTIIKSLPFSTDNIKTIKMEPIRFKINSTGSKTIFTIGHQHINQSLVLTVDNATYLIGISIKALIRPYACTKIQFETSFGELSDYSVVDTFDTSNVQIIDDVSFCFSILNDIVYGRSFSDQIVLKGSPKILEFLK